MKRSAGILLYKKEDNKYLVLLAHFGGLIGKSKILVLGLFKRELLKRMRK